MLQEALANVACRDTHDSVFASVIGRGSSKELDTNHTLFQGLEISGDGLLDNVAQELPAPVASSESGAFDNAFQVLPQLGYIGLGFGESQDLRLASVDGVHG
jgi:hypothetical protein